MTDFLDRNDNRELIRFSTRYSAVIDPKDMMIQNLGTENDDDYVDADGFRYINTDALSAKEIIELLETNDDLHFEWHITPTEFAAEDDISITVEPEKSVKDYLNESLRDF